MPKEPKQGTADDIAELLLSMGVSLPFEKMRQSHNVIEAIPGTTKMGEMPSNRIIHLKDFDNPLSRAAGYEDLPNPFVGMIRER